MSQFPADNTHTVRMLFLKHYPGRRRFCEVRTFIGAGRIGTDRNYLIEEVAARSDIPAEDQAILLTFLRTAPAGQTLWKPFPRNPRPARLAL